MKEITRAVLSSFIKDYHGLSRGAKIALIVSAAAIFIVITAVLHHFCSTSPSVTLTQKRPDLSALSMTDEKGNKWILDLARAQPFSRIRSSERPGPPLLVKTDVRPINRFNISIGLEVVGQAGEKYVGAVQKNSKLQPPPQFKIVDQAGNVLTSGRFEYG